MTSNNYYMNTSFHPEQVAQNARMKNKVGQAVEGQGATENYREAERCTLELQ